MNKSKAHAPQVNDLLGGARAAFRGIPVAGDLMDEGLAAVHATFGGDRSKSWADRWNSAVEDHRAYDADFDRRNPIPSLLLRTAGGAVFPGGPMAGGAAKLAGAAGGLPKAGVALRWIGGHLMPTRPQLGSKVVVEAGKGLIEGVVDGFGGGHGSFGERLHHAAKHAGRSMTWGAGAPLAGRAFAGMAHDGGKARDAAETARRVEGLLGRIEANGPIAGILPLPYQAY